MVRQAHHKMKKIKILQRDEKILRGKARIIPIKDIGSKKIADIIKGMSQALHAEEDGVAIAAPQIGESLRLFIVDSNILVAKKKLGTDLVFINPEIMKTSKEKKKVEEGCLSIRWLYGQVKRSEKVTIRAFDEKGKQFERGASGLLAQIFQHEVDHLDGILFIDKAENVQEIPPSPRLAQAGQGKPKFVFFGSSKFSTYVLEELEAVGLSPVLNITSAKDPLPLEEIKKIDADVFVVASFGKILPKEVIDLPKYKTLNVHPSLLPKLRGPAPIQNTILGQSEPGITIIRMDEKMDHGPILLQAKVSITPWPDHYNEVEKKLGRASGKILGALLPKWVEGKIREIPQNDAVASYTKLIQKEDGLLNLSDPAEENLNKVLAYSTWPGAYIIYKNKRNKEVRVVVKDATIIDGLFTPIRVIPAGKREMNWQDFLRGNA